MKSTTLIALASAVSGAFAAIQLPPETQMLESKYKDKHPEAKRMKIRHGPFKLEGAGHKGLMYMIEKETGVLTTIKPAMKKPCSDCVLLAAQADLEFADGEQATIDKGAWLHHMVMSSVGNKRVDLVCPVGMPGERFFSSGNERTVTGFADLKPGSTNAGFRVKPGDTWGMEMELMNLNKKDIVTYLTLTWDYLPGQQPGFKSTRAVWFDVTGCFAASEAKPKNDNQFKMTSAPWSSPVTGHILGIGGHVHDGGVNIRTFQNGKEFCNSEATYGGDPKFIQREGTKGGGMSHISHMSFCQDVGPINKGDKFTITAYYDMKKYMPMRNAVGGLSTVMGIAIMYVLI